MGQKNFTIFHDERHSLKFKDSNLFFFVINNFINLIFEYRFNKFPNILIKFIFKLYLISMKLETN